ncbi:MAG: hypothetical protein JW873_06195 [Candidatus Saganbacteria bacterium]|nr:hypothetical protein [Candidatus Saganbacteria bacterium]
MIGVALVCVMPAAAFAASSLTFGSLAGPNGAPLTLDMIHAFTPNMPSGLLEAFWSDPSGSDPRPNPPANAMKIASSISTFNINPANSISDVLPSSKYFAYMNAPGYYFWRFNDDAAPGATVYVRIWSDDSRKYYVYDSFANGAKADSPHTTSIAASSWYKADKPYTPLITQFDEVSTTIVETGAKSGSLKVTSAAPAPTDGQRQVTEIAWQMGTDPSGLSTVAGATSPVLTLDQAGLTVGQTYYFQTVYKNWFGPSASVIQPYTLAGTTGMPGPGIKLVTYNLTSTGLGLNVVAYDFDTTKGPITATDKSTGATITVVDPTSPPPDNMFTIGKLINEINRQAGSAIVKSVGYYDNTSKKQVGLTAVAANLADSAATGDTAAAILAHVVKEPLQIGVSANLSFSLSGTK